MSPTIFEKNRPSDRAVAASLKSTKLGSFWLDDVDQRSTLPSFVSGGSTDLAIVGGGYLGLWTAILAKERHPSRRVTLLEAHRTGHAASGRNGGFCEASITHGQRNGERRWPEEFDRLQELGVQNLNELEATLVRHGLDCNFERVGMMTVATETHQVAELQSWGDALTGTEAQAEVKSPTFLAGHWDKKDVALVHPGKLAGELTRLALHLGVEIFEESKVERLEAHKSHILLRTSRATLQAQHVVLATNAYPSLLKRHRWHILPIYDYVLVTEQLTAAQLTSIGWTHRQGLTDMANQFHYYRLTPDNRILFGGYDAIYHRGSKLRAAYEDRTETYQTLASHFFTTFPQLDGLKFSHRWAGVIDTSTRFCSFFADAMGGRVQYVAGFTGLGVGATRFAAKVLLDKADGRDTELTRLSMVRQMPLPFPPEPIRSLVVQLTRWSLARADRNQGRRNIFLRTMDALGLGFDS